MTMSDTLMWMPPTLETDRLILRALSESDIPAIFAYSKNPEVAKYTMWDAHETLEDTRLFFKTHVTTMYNRGEPEPFGICLKEDPDTVLGTVGCWWVSRDYHSMEMGYCLAESLWNKGIVTEAAQTVMSYVFDNYKVERLQALHKVGNESSGRVMEKLGFTKEGCLRSARYHRKQFWDVMYYSILRRDMRH